MYFRQKIANAGFFLKWFKKRINFWNIRYFENTYKYVWTYIVCNKFVLLSTCHNKESVIIIDVYKQWMTRPQKFQIQNEYWILLLFLLFFCRCCCCSIVYELLIGLLSFNRRGEECEIRIKVITLLTLQLFTYIISFIGLCGKLLRFKRCRNVMNN